MTLRAIIRDISWLLREAIPFQAIAAARGCDFTIPTHPIPGCPNPGDCREWDCQGHCSEALEAEGRMEADGPDAAEVLTCDRFAGFCFACGADYGQGCRQSSPAAASAAGDQREGGERIPPVPTLPRPQTSVVHAGTADDPSRNIVGNERDEGLAQRDPSPDPCARHLNFVDWAVPAICTVLALHSPRSLNGGIHCDSTYDQDDYCSHFDDWQAWHEHVAPLIAERIENALLKGFPQHEVRL